MIGIFLDIETSGLDFYQHEVLEIAVKLIDLVSKKELKAYQSIVCVKKEQWEKSDPESLKVNGFTYEKALSGKQASEVQQNILSLFEEQQINRKNSIFICQNPSFDRAFFGKIIPPYEQEKRNWPYHWLDLASMFWAFIFKKYTSKNSPPPWEIGVSKNKIAKFFNLKEEKTPHSAMRGVDHLIDCYFKLYAED